VLTGVKYVTLYVSDQDKALDFYTKVLGFEKRVDNPAMGSAARFLGVGLEGQDMPVILWPGTPGQPTQADGPVPGTVIIETNDCRDDFERLSALGVAFDEAEPAVTPYGVNVTAVDPDGNRIRLNQRPVGAPTRPRQPTDEQAGSSATAVAAS
jgi:catechol 2,3-dioxygenase-like lactoylglutathione lyase family enzyme